MLRKMIDKDKIQLSQNEDKKTTLIDNKLTRETTTSNTNYHFFNEWQC